MERYPPSQGEVVAAFLKDLNRERGTCYEIVGRPDEVERTLPEVDYILRDEAHPPEVAVEASTTWRSEEAGREDAAWSKWTEAVRSHVRGQVKGQFRLSTPMRIPRGFPPEPFAESLVKLLHRETASLARLHREGRWAPFTVCGMRVIVGYAKDEGSDISFARMFSEEDRRELPGHVKRLVAKKSGKLRRHKEAGRETWLVVYNTFWPAMSPVEVRKVVLGALGSEHDHIDHIGIVGGNPPDDAWLDIVR